MAPRDSGLRDLCHRIKVSHKCQERERKRKGNVIRCFVSPGALRFLSSGKHVLTAFFVGIVIPSKITQRSKSICRRHVSPTTADVNLEMSLIKTYLCCGLDGPTT